MKPESYRIQKSCCNCKHVFEKYDYDSPSDYYCTFNSQTRPKCGSVSMKEDFSDFHIHFEINLEERLEWEKWSRDNEVMPHGICDNHEDK